MGDAPGPAAPATAATPFAWAKAHRLLRTIDASPNEITNRGTVVAARIVAMIGTGLLVLLLFTSLAG